MKLLVKVKIYIKQLYLSKFVIKSRKKKAMQTKTPYEERKPVLNQPKSIMKSSKEPKCKIQDSVCKENISVLINESAENSKSNLKILI